MAAVVAPGTADELDLSKLSEALMKQLPAYAVPIFLRVVEQLDITGEYSVQLHNCFSFPRPSTYIVQHTVHSNQSIASVRNPFSPLFPKPLSSSYAATRACESDPLDIDFF